VFLIFEPDIYVYVY